MSKQTPPVCSYEGSDYQQRFWEEGNRTYEDAVEAIALKRLLPAEGNFMLELGAGAGRNTPRYQSYERVALLDYSRTQLEQARDRLGQSDRYLYIAADVYRLPFVDGLFDGATMIRTLHHMSDPVLALSEVRRVMEPGGTFILEFANKRNIKAVLRYWMRKQKWNPFSQEPFEFAELNFDFHPKAVRRYLTQNMFEIEKQLTVSHFRVGFLKRNISTALLAKLDSILQCTGSFAQYSPSIFTRALAVGEPSANAIEAGIFRCVVCGTALSGIGHDLTCPTCGAVWEYRDGIYDFRDKNVA
jgi:ubiquinone/menaquinone biosynthesis C-methylase UbiE